MPLLVSVPYHTDSCRLQLSGGPSRSSLLITSSNGTSGAPSQITLRAVRAPSEIRPTSTLARWSVHHNSSSSISSTASPFARAVLNLSSASRTSGCSPNSCRRGHGRRVHRPHRLRARDEGIGGVRPRTSSTSPMTDVCRCATTNSARSVSSTGTRLCLMLAAPMSTLIGDNRLSLIIAVALEPRR